MVGEDGVGGGVAGRLPQILTSAVSASYLPSGDDIATDISSLAVVIGCLAPSLGRVTQGTVTVASRFP